MKSKRKKRKSNSTNEDIPCRKNSFDLSDLLYCNGSLQVGSHVAILQDEILVIYSQAARKMST